jgi:uncharacterized protein
MQRDDLNIPLQRQSLRQRLWAKRPSALALAYGCSVLAFVAGGVFAWKTPNPMAGEPVVVAAVPAPEEFITASIEPVPEAAPAEPDVPADDTPEVANATEEFETGSEVPVPDVPEADDGVEQVGGRKRVVLKIEEAPRQDTYKEATGNIIISSRRPLTLAPVKSISEYTGDGILPKLGAGGKAAASIYARPVPLNIVHSDSPKIAIVLGGMGLSAKLTARAIDELPADVTLAFAPYGNDLQGQVNAARKEGHEVFLQIPLEPVGFPATNPGPKTLQSDQDLEENLKSLHWHMSRFAGYAGVVNYMGGRFLTEETATLGLLKEIKKRGLVFVEDGSVPLSVVEGQAAASRAKVRRAQAVIDANPTPDAILAALRQLEQEAEQNGVAIGTGAGLSMTIDVVRDWAKDAASRGIVIIPMSAAFKGRVG